MEEHVAVFVLGWKEVRAVRFAEAWLKERPTGSVCNLITLRLGKRPWRALPLFLEELARADLPDRDRDNLIENLYGILYRVESHPRHPEGERALVDHLHHASPEVRWTAVFCLAYRKEYREQIETLVTDETLARFGYVSRIAKNALRIIDGEPGLDLFYGSAYEARANGTPTLT
ncbi:hypothetical protein EON81_04575 [bacterium]|nr:MAG: hypothetical protein EON81_04575 [bacterium]